jgi:outer membrane cobalamin receptor
MTLFALAAAFLGVAAASPDAGLEIEGEVHGRNGAPVVEAKLVLFGADHVAVEATDTDQRGRFRIPSVPPGHYVLEVRAEDFAPLQQLIELHEPIGNLSLSLEPLADRYKTVVHGAGGPFPARDGTSTSTVTQTLVESLPGGATRELNDVVATQSGITRDNFGAIHVRGNFSGLLLRIDGIPIPPEAQDRLQQLLESQIVDTADVTIGGVPAEFGRALGGLVDIQTPHPEGAPSGNALLEYGTYDELKAQANVAANLGPLHVFAAGSLESTDRGLDPPAASPILHDQLHDGRFFVRVEDDPTVRDRLTVMAAYSESHYQIPIDPTLLPLSDGPPGAQRGPDQYGNMPPTFVPYDSNPTEVEQDLFAAASWTRDFGDGAILHIASYARFQDSVLDCDTVHELGATADPGTTCSDVHHRVLEGGAAINQSWKWEWNEFKAGVIAEYQRSTAAYTEYVRDDASPLGGVDSALTASGQDDIDIVFAGVFLQDRITLGKLTLFPGLRLDVQNAGLEGAKLSSTLWGPSYRLGASYALTDAVIAHAFVGQLWQPPTFDAPTAARVLGLVPAGTAIPFDLKGETDQCAELGVVDRLLPQLTVGLTAWGRLSQYTLDDNEVGDTALTAEYNYARGRAAGVEAAVSVNVAKRVTGFANAALETAQGEGIVSARYLFTPQQLAFPGYQTVDNSQLLTANAGIDLSDGGTTHLSGLLTFGSGLRTGPTNNETLPPYTVLDVGLRHRFDVPLRPEVALDVKNLFNVIYAYRIATGSLAGSAYGSLREIDIRLIVHWGHDT